MSTTDITSTLLTSLESISTTEYSTFSFTTPFDGTSPTDFTSETYLNENLLDGDAFVTLESAQADYETTIEEVYSTVRTGSDFIR